MNEYVLVTDRTGTVIARGTEAQCEFAKQAMITYGISEDRLFICPTEYWNDFHEGDKWNSSLPKRN